MNFSVWEVIYSPKNKTSFDFSFLTQLDISKTLVTRLWIQQENHHCEIGIMPYSHKLTYKSNRNECCRIYLLHHSRSL